MRVPFFAFVERWRLVPLSDALDGRVSVDDAIAPRVVRPRRAARPHATLRGCLGLGGAFMVTLHNLGAAIVVRDPQLSIIALRRIRDWRINHWLIRDERAVA